MIGKLLNPIHSHIFFFITGDFETSIGVQVSKSIRIDAKLSHIVVVFFFSFLNSFV